MKQQAELLSKIKHLLMRITDEQVPLFGSNRLKTLHKDCGELLREVETALHSTDPLLQGGGDKDEGAMVPSSWKSPDGY